MKKLVKWLLLVIGMLVIGITVLIYNPGIFKGVLEDYLSNLSGYSVSIDGDLEINPGRQLALLVTQIHVSNPQWAGEKTLLELDSLNLVVDSASLFSDTTIIESLLIDGLTIKLESNAAAEGNWLVRRTTTAKKEHKNQQSLVILKRVGVANSMLTYLNGETGKNQELHIALFNQHQGDDGMLQIKLDGSLNQRLVEYTGSIGPFENLVAGSDVIFNGNGHFGSLNITAEGLIDNLQKPRQPQFKLELHGQDTDDITSMLGIDDLGTGEFSLHAHSETLNGQYSADIRGNFGDLSVYVTAQATDLLDLDTINLEMDIKGPRLGRVARILGMKNWPDKPFILKAEVVREGSRVNVPGLSLNIGGAELKLDALLTNFPALDDSRINLSVEGDDITQFRQLLGISGIATGAFALHGKLETSPEHVELIQIDLKTSLGQAALSGTLGPGPKYIGTKLYVNMQGNDANLFMSAFNLDVLPQQPFKLDAGLELLEEGLQINRGILLSIDDDQLELDGLIGLNPGGVGSNFDFRLSGGNLAEMLGGIGAGLKIPAKPYQLSSSVHLLKEGISLNNFKAEFETFHLAAEGLIVPHNQLVGTAVDFQVSGENLSALERFPAIGNSIDIFVPGQTYQLGGRFSIAENSWQLEKISGKVGSTDITFDSLLTPKDRWIGSHAQFSIKGPEFNGLVNKKADTNLPIGRFSSAGTLALNADRLNLSDFSFDSDRLQGKIDLQLGWPLTVNNHYRYDIDIMGEDINFILPELKAFKPAQADFVVRVKGQSSSNKLALEEFELRVGELQVSLRGDVDDAGGNRVNKNMQLAMRAVSGDISTLGELNGEPLPPLALDIAAEFDGNADDFSISKINGVIGESRFSGNLDVSLKGARPLIDLNINSSYIDLRPFLPPVEEKTATTSATSKRLIPARPLPVEKLKLINGKLKLNIKKLEYRQASLRNLLLDAELIDGALKIPTLMASGPSGHFTASASVLPTANDRTAVKLDLVAKDLHLNLLGQAYAKQQRLPLIDLSFAVYGDGGNLQELAGSLNGAVHMGSKGGTLQGVNLSILDTFFFEELANMVLPSSDNNVDLNTSCAAAILKITDGVVETDPALAFTTDKITLIAKGKLNLKTEKMHFNFNTIPNKAYKFSASELINPYILVSGTLKKPSVGVDPAKALVRGGIAVGTAGISILAKGALDRFTNTSPLCEQMLEQVQSR